ncbi:MAG: hypothetical protein JST91_00875 [Actinobacteria bacterium]|nr:hypothetical protein [Actinomycetota bacterium]
MLKLYNVSQTIAYLDPDEKQQVSATIINSDSRPGSGPQSISLINESGLYSLVLSRSSFSLLDDDEKGASTIRNAQVNAQMSVINESSVRS